MSAWHNMTHSSPLPVNWHTLWHHMILDDLVNHSAAMILDHGKTDRHLTFQAFLPWWYLQGWCNYASSYPFLSPFNCLWLWIAKWSQTKCGEASFAGIWKISSQWRTMARQFILWQVRIILWELIDQEN